MNEPGSTFECRMDGVAFTSCDASGITYTDLANGSHAFQVRATDPSKNTDQTPAGYTFGVAVPGPPPPPPPTPTTPTTPRLSLPETAIGLKPPAKTRDRTPTFRFRSSEAGATFRCKVDAGAFKACRSPFSAPKLRLGKHTFKVLAIASGASDPTPATYSFKVVKR